MIRDIGLELITVEMTIEVLISLYFLGFTICNLISDFIISWDMN